jgi:hypothetical protein
MLTTSGSEWQCCPSIYCILIKKHLTERHLVDTFSVFGVQSTVDLINGVVAVSTKLVSVKSFSAK